MPKGSPRPTGGRRGQYDVKAPWLVVEKASPLDVLLEIMRSVEAPLKLRAWAAKEAAPYCHRKLAPETAAEAKEAAAPTMTPAEVEWSRDLDIRPPN